MLCRAFEHRLVAQWNGPVEYCISGEDVVAGPESDGVHRFYAILAIAQTVSPAHSALAQIPQSKQEVGEILHTPPDQGEPEVICRSGRMPPRYGWVEYKRPRDIVLLSQHLNPFRRVAVIEVIINACLLKRAVLAGCSLFCAICSPLDADERSEVGSKAAAQRISRPLGEVGVGVEHNFCLELR